MVKKISMNVLNKTLKYQRVIRYIREHGAVVSKDMISRNITAREAGALLKYMYEIELLNRKKVDNVWIYTLPFELKEKEFEWL